MTAHRLRETDAGYMDEVGLIEVLLYGAASPRTHRRGTVWVPPTDVYETEDNLVILAEIAGVLPTDFSVSLHERRLTICGTRSDRGPARRAYHQLEVHFGEFRTELDLPVAVEAGRADAQYSDGFLRVVLPKVKPRLIDAAE
ncbi:MAG: Hsp20/alpha crystallin family protein [Anaerolineales bacterium]